MYKKYDDDADDEIEETYQIQNIHVSMALYSAPYQIYIYIYIHVFYTIT